MKVRSSQPPVPNPPTPQKSEVRQTNQTATAKTDGRGENVRPSTPAQESTDASTLPTSDRAATVAERDILSNYMRDRLVQAAKDGGANRANPAEAGRVAQDPRQHGLDNGSNLPGVETEGANPADELVDNARGPVGGDLNDVRGGSPSNDRPDPTHGAWDAEEHFNQSLGDRISQRSSGEAGSKDPNSQSDGDVATWAGLTYAGLAGALVSNPVGLAGAVGAAVVGGLNYVYDSIIEDMDNDIPETVDHEAVNDAKVESDVNEGDGGGGDVSDETENEATLEYVLENQTSPHPDDTSGDNPNPAPTPDLNPRPSIDARDTVRTPADPYGTEPTAEELQQRIDSMQRFGPRTQNAINPGDHGGNVGGNPDAPLPEDLPGEDPVGDPGSPEGPNQQ